MDYLGNLSKAIKISWGNKYLWVWGVILALFSSGSSFTSNFSSGGSSNSTGTSINAAYNNLTSYLKSINPAVIIAVVVVVLTIILVWDILAVYFSSRAHAALISSTIKLNSGENSSLKEGWQASSKYWWRIFLSNLLISLPMAIVFLIMLIVIILLIMISGGARTLSSGAISLTILLDIFLPLGCAGIIVVIYSLFASLFFSFRVQLIVDGDLGAIAAIKKSFDISKHKMADILISGLVGILPSLLIIPVVIAIFVFAVIVVLFAVLIALLSQIAGILVGLVGVVIILLIYLLALGILDTLLQVYWTIVYTKLHA